MNIKKDILWRVIVSILMLTGLGVAILWSAVRLQVVEGDHWRSVSDSLHVTHRTIPAVRGSIYSDDGSLLSTSVPIYKVSLDFEVINRLHSDSFEQYTNELAEKLSRTLENRSAEEFKQLLTTGYRKKSRYVTISRHANFIQTRDIQNLPIFNAGRYKGGVILEERTIRKKPYDELMFRTIGFINENHKGAGIEASYDDILTGEDGRMVVRRITSGYYRPIDNNMKLSAKDGKDIFTTVNIHLQDLVHEALATGIEANDAEHGTAILLDVKTGQIKAIANLNKTENGVAERYNHALGMLYEPGSTVKIVSALAALEEGHVDTDDSIDVHNGKYKFFENDSIMDSGHGDHRNLTYQQVVEKSSNVGISLTAYNGFKNKPNDFIEYFDELHLTTALQTGIKGEAEPFILRPNKPGWSGMSVPSISIGYSFNTSPLHMAMLYNAIANNGVMMHPYLIKGIGRFGQIEEAYEPTTLNKKICSESTLASLKQMLEGVVQNGTASKLKNVGFPVAGKTGTSRISDSKSGYTKQYHSSFVGYFPADQPKYTLIVVISKPSKGRYYGASVALPVFKEIASRIYANAVHQKMVDKDTIVLPEQLTGTYAEVKTLAKRYDLPMEFKSRKNELVSAKPTGDFLGGSAITMSDNTMPELKGMGLTDCLYLLENKGFKVSHRGNGKVVEQFPLPGTKMPRGKTVYLRLSTEK